MMLAVERESEMDWEAGGGRSYISSRCRQVSAAAAVVTCHPSPQQSTASASASNDNGGGRWTRVGQGDAELSDQVGGMPD